MLLYKTDNCPFCVRLNDWMEKSNIEVDIEVTTIEALRAGMHPFKTVPSLVLENGTVIDGFLNIRLYLHNNNQ